jgi:hypothetical protein
MGLSAWPGPMSGGAGIVGAPTRAPAARGWDPCDEPAASGASWLLIGWTSSGGHCQPLLRVTARRGEQPPGRVGSTPQRGRQVGDQAMKNGRGPAFRIRLPRHTQSRGSYRAPNNVFNDHLAAGTLGRSVEPERRCSPYRLNRLGDVHFWRCPGSHRPRTLGGSEWPRPR